MSSDFNMPTKYSESQIEGACKNALLHGHPRPPRDKAIAFLDWYLAHKTDYLSVHEGMRAAFSGLLTNGLRQQEVVWQELLGE